MSTKPTRTPLPTISLCLSCSSTIRSTKNIDSFKTPCCSSPICDKCLEVNPRLRNWVPCLRCGDGVAAVGTGRIGKVNKSNHPTQEQQFSLGDDSDFSDTESTLDDTSLTPSSPPPGYSSKVIDIPEEELDNSWSNSTNKEDGIASGSGSRSSSIPRSIKPEEQILHTESLELDEQEEPPKHIVRRGETVRSVATKYGLDPYDLLKINALPYESLHSNPHLLQTRPFIYLARQSKGKQSIEGVEGSVEGLDRKDGDNNDVAFKKAMNEEDEKRRLERRMKRFQLITKTPNPIIAKTYLALQSLPSATDPEDVLFDFSEIEQQESTIKPEPEKEFNEKEKAGKKGGIESRAIEGFFDDEEWETEQGKGESSSGRGVRWFGGKVGRVGTSESTGAGVKTGKFVRGAPWIET